MNFSPIYIKTDKAFWGNQSKNGTFLGPIGAAEYEKADIISNVISLRNYNTSNIVFLTSLSQIEIYFVIKVPDMRKELVLSSLENMDDLTRLMIAICSITFPFLLCFIRKIEAKLYNDLKVVDTKLSSSFLYVYGIIWNSSQRLLKLNSSRIFSVALFFYALITTSIFQGTVIKNLNTNILMGEIKTVDQILDNNYNILLIDGIGAVFRNSTGSRVLNKLSELSNEFILMKEAIEVAKKYEKRAMVMADIYVKYIINQNFHNETKKDVFLRVPEPISQFYVTWPLPKNSPFQDKINLIIQHIVESGIFRYQISFSILESDKILIRRILAGDVPHPDSKQIIVENLSSVFSAYLFLIGLCIVMFFVEVLFSFTQKNRKKAFKTIMKKNYSNSTKK